jgi:restriction system protein
MRRNYSSLEKERRCHFCNIEMTVVPELGGGDSNDYVLLCPLCGFWFGHGTRFEGPTGGRGVISRIRKEPLTSLNIPVDSLLRNLNSHPDYLLRINPYKAEEVVTRLLADALNCEVYHLGGRKDRGIDAYVLSNDEMKTIIQVKWHEDMRKAESVKVVKELAATLLEHGVPSGILVTTRRDLSQPAKETIARIGTRAIEGMGRFDISYKTYSDILSMLEISSRKVTEAPKISVELDEFDTVFDMKGIYDLDGNYEGDGDVPRPLTREELEKLMGPRE